MCRIILLLAVVLSMWANGASSQGQAKDFFGTARTPANTLEESRAFYKRIGFRQLEDNAFAFTDGKIVVEIDTNKFARPGINLYKQDWGHELQILKETANVIKMPQGFALTDPNGVWIYLIETDRAAPAYADSSFSLLGNNEGVYLETGNMKASYDLYSALGFRQTTGSPEKGYVILSDKYGFKVTLMKPGLCPHLFFNPSLTYFNGKRNISIIEKMKKLKVEIIQEVTWFNKEGVTDNVIIRDPGGYGFFIFND